MFGSASPIRSEKGAFKPYQRQPSFWASPKRLFFPSEYSSDNGLLTARTELKDLASAPYDVARCACDVPSKERPVIVICARCQLVFASAAMAKTNGDSASLTPS